NTAPTALNFYENAINAAARCIAENSLAPTAVCLTSQVGSYLMYSPQLPPHKMALRGWQAAAASDEIAQFMAARSSGYWQREIGMQHPMLWSYPGPFLLLQKEQEGARFPSFEKLLSIKDYLYYRFTGLFYSDPYTWRGLAMGRELGYSQRYLQDLGISSSLLPTLAEPGSAPGGLLPALARQLGLAPGTPVYLGCNDFFAGLLGSGCTGPEAAFDVTGTSEHLGLVQSRPQTQPLLISGPYFSGYANYGVTASSGSTLRWAETVMADLPEALPPKELPVFLPYLNGERTPLYTPGASGTVVGLRETHTRQDIAAAAVCGVVYSLYSIWKLFPEADTAAVAALRVTGGATRIPLYNQIKADLFGIPLEIPVQSEGSALGAAMLAAVGMGWFCSLHEAAKAWQPTCRLVTPNPGSRQYHLEAYEKYCRVSRHMSPLFQAGQGPANTT
ncbi:MAG: xylulokinase, partial [Oscillospiraceae bacterium]